MKNILAFLLLIFSLQSFGQTIVDPKDFPSETNPQQSNFEFYSRKTGTNKKATFDNVRKRMLPTLSFPNNITYTPSNTGNTANLGQFVTDPNGKIWYIDGLGVAKWVNTPASIALLVADNDEAARLMCVPLNGWYRLSANNTIGAAPGTLRQRVYGAALSLPCTPTATPSIPGEVTIYGGGGILKTSGDPDSNSYVKKQFQWYEASAAWDTVRNELYFYHGADPVGSRWDKFTGEGGLTNGDKIDIRVSGSGDTLTIDTGAVTSVKILDGTIVDADIATTGVTAGSYTNPNFTVNSKGQITEASNGAAGGSSIDSSFVKKSGSYSGKRITDNIYRTGKTGFGTNDTTSVVTISENAVSSNINPALMVKGRTNGDSINIFINLKSSAKDSTSDFVMGAINSGTISGAGDNTSYCFGHNYLPGGSRINNSESAEAMMFESAFVNGLPLVGNVPSSEMHWMFVPGIGNPTNIQIRPLSFALDWKGRVGDFSLQTDKVNFIRVGTAMGFMPAKTSTWAQLDFYNKIWGFNDTLTLRFEKNNNALLVQRNAANTNYVGVIKVDASDQVLLGGQNESRVAAYNHLRITNGGLLTNENNNILIGNSTYPNRLYVENNSADLLTLTKTGATYNNTFALNGTDFYYQSSSGNAPFGISLAAPHVSLWMSSSGAIGLGTAGPSARLHILGPSGATSSLMRIENTTGANDIFRSNASPASVISGNPGDITLTNISGAGGMWLKTSGTNSTGGWVQFTPSTVSGTTGFLPVFTNTTSIGDSYLSQSGGTTLNIGSSSVGKLMKVYHDYSSTSAAGAEAWAPIHLINRNSTNNNWSAIEWDNSSGVIAGDIAFQHTNHTSAYGDVVFHTRGAVTSFGEAMRITSEKNVGIAGTPTARLHLPAGTTAATTAPLKFTAGTNMTTAEAGAVEWNGSNLFITQTSGPTRKTLAYTTDVKLSSLFAADATNSIDNLNYGQTWAWSTMNTGTPMTWTNAGLTSGTGLLHTANALTTGTIHQLSTTNNSLNSTLGLLHVANNGTSTNGLVASFQSNSTAETGLYVRANAKVGINETNPAVTLDIVGTDAVHLPGGSTAQRPGSPTGGMFRFNSDVGVVEFYDGSDWQSPAVSNSGTLTNFFTDVSNTGTGETDLYTYTTASGTLTADGQKLFFNYTLNLNDITATATAKIYFAGTVIANTGALTVSATGAVIVSGWLIRTSSSTARASVNISSPTASTAVYTAETDLTSLNFATTNIIKITGTAGGAGGGTGDITAKLGTIEKRL